MKTCPNCSAIYSDDYAGTCNDCGRGLGSVSGVSQSLEGRYAAQRSRANQASMMEQQVEKGNYDSIRANDPIMDVARDFVIDKRSPEQRERDEAIGA